MRRWRLLGALLPASGLVVATLATVDPAAAAVPANAGWRGTLGVHVVDGSPGHGTTWDIMYTLDGMLVDPGSVTFPNPSFTQLGTWSGTYALSDTDVCDANHDGTPETYPWTQTATNNGSGTVVVKYSDPSAPNYYSIGTAPDGATHSFTSQDVSTPCGVHQGGTVGYPGFVLPSDGSMAQDSSNFTHITGPTWDLVRDPGCTPPKIVKTTLPDGFTPLVRFNATGSGAGAVTWDFGDGTTSALRVVNHTYTGAGPYNVRLTVNPSCPASTSWQVVADPVHYYAPALTLHPKETYFPEDPNRFIARSDLRFDRPNGVGTACQDQILAYGSQQARPPLLDPARLGSASANPYSHLASSSVPLTGGGYTCQDAGPVFANSSYLVVAKTKADEDGYVLKLANNPSWQAGNSSLNLPLYAEYQQGRYILYWFFYAYNGWSFGKAPVHITERHEGDWEHIVVRITQTGKIQQVAFYEHYCNAKIKALAKVEFDGSHPIAYAALGGHATYASTGTLGRQFGCIGTQNPPSQISPYDRVGKGPEWQTWFNVQDATQQPWYGFGGSWGTLVPSTFAHYGPAGPGPLRSSASDVIPAGW